MEGIKEISTRLDKEDKVWITLHTYSSTKSDFYATTTLNQLEEGIMGYHTQLVLSKEDSKRLRDELNKVLD